MSVFNDIRIVAEWSTQDASNFEHVKDHSVLKGVSSKLQKSMDIINLSAAVSPLVVKSLSPLRSEWHCALSSDGEYLAIAKENKLEIRSISSNYEDVVAESMLRQDQFPKWRRLCWSPNSKILALSRSDGQIHLFSWHTELLFTLPNVCTILHGHKPNVSDEQSGKGIGHLEPLSGLHFFACPKDRSNLLRRKYTYELLAITFDGKLVCYLVNVEDPYEPPKNPNATNKRKSVFIRKTKTEYAVAYTYSFSEWHEVITCTSLNSESSVLCIGGRGVDIPDVDSGLSNIESISLWDILANEPYLRQLYSSSGMSIARHHTTLGFWHTFSSLFYFFGKNSETYLESVASIVAISPNAQFIASSNLMGDIHIWKSNSQRENWELYAFWSREQIASHISDKIKAEYSGENESYEKMDKKLPDEQKAIAMVWWDETRIALVFNSGQVILTSTNYLENTLHASNCFRNCIETTQRTSSGFFALEKEEFKLKARLVGKKLILTRVRQEKSEEELTGSFPLSWVRPVVNGLNFSIYYVTSMFIGQYDPNEMPENWKIIPTCKYRLVRFKETSSTDLLERKVETLKFGEALDLALKHNLDTDIVYKAMWNDTEVSKESINEILANIKDKSWVLSTCVERVPSNPTAMKELLEYGLKLSDIRSTIDNIEKRTVILDRPQRQVCKYRMILLKYLDRLLTYRELFNALEKERQPTESLVETVKSDEWHRFGEDYPLFREANIIVFAMELAYQARFSLLEILIRRNSAELLPFRLAILEQIPETVGPELYEKLLPVCSQSGESAIETTWSEYLSPWRSLDWVEEYFKPQLGWIEDSQTAEFGSVQPRSINFPAAQEDLTQWYTKRVFSVDRISGRIDFCQKLMTLGQNKLIAGLESTSNELQWFSEVAYNFFSQKDSAKFAVTMRFSEFRDLKMKDLLALFLSDTNEVNFSHNFSNFVLPYMRKISTDKRSLKENMHEFWYATLKLADDHLDCCAIVLSELKDCYSDLGFGAVDLSIFVLACLYGRSKITEIDIANDFVDLLPSFEHKKVSAKWQIQGKLSPKNLYTYLHSLDENSVAAYLEIFASHLLALQIFDSYQVPVALNWVLSSESNLELQKEKFVAVLYSAVRLADDKENFDQTISVFLQDIANLREGFYIFMGIPEEEISEILISELLNKAHFQMTSKLIRSPPTLFLMSDEKAEQIILAKAMTYLDNADSGSKNNKYIKMAHEW